MLHRLLALALLASLCACSSVDDYLEDLRVTTPQRRSGGIESADAPVIFDAGQMAHEALVGLTTVEEMSFWQAMFSLSRASLFLLRAENNALLRSDAAALIAHLTTRLPIPPPTEPYLHEFDRDIAAEADRDHRRGSDPPGDRQRRRDASGPR